MKKHLFLLFLLFLLPSFLFFAFVSPSLVGTLAQALVQSQQGGLGGAYGATLSPPSSTVALAAAGSDSLAPPKMYGGSGQGGACLGTYGAGNDITTMDFGWAASDLTKKWQDYPSYRLCNDYYIWQNVTELPVQTVLQTLHRPSDLLNPQYANKMVIVEPLSSLDPNTQQVQQQQQASKQNQSTSSCDWVPDLIFVHPHIDICAPIRLLVHAGASGIRSVYQNATTQIDFLWKTPLQPFQEDASSGLLSVWSISWAIVCASITAVIAYGALRYMIGSTVNWLAYANLTELIPRLLFGLLAAYFSKQFFIMLIQANNALSVIFNQKSLDTVINGQATGVIDESLQIVYGLMGFLLIIEEIARIAIIYLLFAFSPILFFLAALRETQRWAKTAAVAAILFIFLQAIQSATLDVGGKVLSSVLHNTEGHLGFLNLLVSLAILYVTLMLFFSLTRMALGGGAYPLGAGVAGAFAFSGRLGSATAGTIGQTAARYRHTRNNLFPLPGPDGRTPGSPEKDRVKGGSDTGGVNGGSGNSGTGGQTAVLIGGPQGKTPFITGKPGNQKPSGPDSAGGSGSSSNQKPGGSGGQKPGGTGGAGAQVPGASSTHVVSVSGIRPPHTVPVVRTTSPTPGRSSSTSSGLGVGAPSPSNKTGQWQKTPLWRLPSPPIDPNNTSSR